MIEFLQEKEGAPYGVTTEIIFVYGRGGGCIGIFYDYNGDIYIWIYLYTMEFILDKVKRYYWLIKQQFIVLQLM